MVYSLLGGIQAVVWTDAIQGIVMISGAVFCLMYIMFSMPEGPTQMFEIAQASQKFSLGSFDLNLSESTFWVVLIYGIFINLQNYGIDQNYIQRYMASKSDEEAKKSAFFGGMLYIPVSLVFFLIGTALFAFYSLPTNSLPAELQNPDFSDRVFPYFIVTQLPSGFTGLLIASIFAAGMSTVSTSINSGSTVILTDYYQRYVKKAATEKDSLKVLYISSLAFSVIGICIGVAMINVQSALDAWWKLASVFSGGMLGLFLLGAFVKTVHVKGAIIGVLLGLIAIFWLSLSPILFTNAPFSHFASPFHTYLTIVIGTLIIFFTGFLATIWNKEKRQK
jgi:SSS family solute:Na+ symporter